MSVPTITAAAAGEELERAASWQRDALAAVFTAVRSSAAGLSGIEAAARLRIHGLNIVERRRKWPLALEFLLRFRNPLVLLLIASSAFLGVTGDMTSTAIIRFMVGASVTLDLVQEHRAEHAVERLQATVAVTARVLRDGVRRQVPVATIVRFRASPRSGVAGN